MKTVTSFIFNLSARILFTAVSVISGFFLIRYLGPNQYGIIGIYSTLLQFIPGLICFSLFESYGKEFAQRGMEPALFSESLISVSTLGIGSIFLILSTVSFINKLIDINLEFWIYILLALHLFFYLVNALYEKALESIGKPQVTSSVQFITGFITIIAVFYTIIFKQDYKPFLISQLFISLSSLIIYVIYCSSAGLIKKYTLSFDSENFKRVFKYGFSIYLAGLFFLLLQRIPVFITQKYYGLAYVSFLNVPLNLYGRLYLPVYALSTVLSPKFSNGDEKSNSLNFEYGFRLLLILFILAVGFFLAGSYRLIPILYGSKFAEASEPAMILAPFLLFYAIDIFFNSTINYLGIATLRLRFIKFASMVDIIAIIAGTKFFGFAGLLASFSISIFTLTFFDFILIKRKVKMNVKIILTDIAKIALCSTPVYLYCYYFSYLNSILYLAGCCVTSAVYFMLIFMSGVINREDVQILIASFRSKGA